MLDASAFVEYHNYPNLQCAIIDERTSAGKCTVHTGKGENGRVVIGFTFVNDTVGVVFIGRPAETNELEVEYVGFSGKGRPMDARGMGARCVVNVEAIRLTCSMPGRGRITYITATK